MTASRSLADNANCAAKRSFPAAALGVTRKAAAAAVCGCALYATSTDGQVYYSECLIERPSGVNVCGSHSFEYPCNCDHCDGDVRTVCRDIRKLRERANLHV